MIKPISSVQTKTLCPCLMLSSLKFHFPSTACLSVFGRPNNFLFYFLRQLLVLIVVIVNINIIIISSEKRNTVWAFSNASKMFAYIEQWVRFVRLITKFLLFNSTFSMLSSTLPSFRRFLIVRDNSLWTRSFSPLTFSYWSLAI